MDIDEGYLGEVSAEDLSEAVTMAAKDAETKGLENMGNKYKSLEADLAAGEFTLGLICFSTSSCLISLASTYTN